MEADRTGHFREHIIQAQQCLRKNFPDIEQAGMFLQFSAGFETETLFDANPLSMKLAELPGMPTYPTPDGVQPQFYFGHCRKLPVLVLAGHRHLCEGNGLLPCLLPTLAAGSLGMRKHLYVGHALSLIPEIKSGHWCLLTDFLNGYAFSPLDGLHSLLENPFPDLSAALSQELNSEIVNAMHQVGLDFRHCTYQSLPGLHFCTGAEAELARKNGADILGHDLVMEIMLAYAMGCKVACIMLAGAQNLHPGKGSKLKREELLLTSKLCSPQLMRGLPIALIEIEKNEKYGSVPRLPEAEADELLQQSTTIKSNKELKLKILRK
ncbi:MAG: purine-nucleoside phosphorylase [Oligosphaeraceae bacterium]|nr:purine-nucleoside phosphorylase [Oligosphaeraceae bacterium]